MNDETEITKKEMVRLENKWKNMVSWHRNLVVADVAYEEACKGDLIGALNTVMDGLVNKRKVGQRTIYAIMNRLIEDGRVPGEIRCYNPGSGKYYLPEEFYKLLRKKNYTDAICCRLFIITQSRACREYWGHNQRLFFNQWKWEVFDVIQRDGGNLLRKNDFPTRALQVLELYDKWEVRYSSFDEWWETHRQIDRIENELRMMHLC